MVAVSIIPTPFLDTIKFPWHITRSFWNIYLSTGQWILHMGIAEVEIWYLDTLCTQRLHAQFKWTANCKELKKKFYQMWQQLWNGSFIFIARRWGSQDEPNRVNIHFFTCQNRRSLIYASADHTQVLSPSSHSQHLKGATEYPLHTWSLRIIPGVTHSPALQGKQYS